MEIRESISTQVRMAIFYENFYEKMKPPDMQLILMQHLKKV